MLRRGGVQTELLASLALVMLTASGIFAAVLLKTHAADVGRLRMLAARALVEEATAPLPKDFASVPGMRWWVTDGAGDAIARGDHAEPIDEAARALAQEARESGRALLRAGPPWTPVHLAAPVGGGGAVAVARMPAAVSRALLAGLLLGDVLIFSAFGAYLLRRRLTQPLQNLAAAARGVGDGALDARVPVEGVRETAEVAAAFNGMVEALASRTRALEKAVADLRQSNRNLREARVGLDRAERLAAVGRLAAGVAHEVGNPMGAILAFLDLARRDSELSPATRDYVARAVKESERVRAILRQLLDFSRPARRDRAPLDLRAVCEETAQLVRAQRRYAHISIEVEAEDGPPPALADRSAVAQIVLNLLLNAADALAGVSDPRIRVRVRPAARQRREGDAADAAARRRSFDAVECAVEDNGRGVPASEAERIFDPFFSTKPVGEGTGLGLSNALRFAEQLGGGLALERRAGPGASFVLTLPAVGRDGEGGEARPG